MAWARGGLEVAGRRRKGQPAPPHVVAEALTQPHRRGARPWLVLDGDEVEPAVVARDGDRLVVWSSLWPDRPDDRVELHLEADGDGSHLEWVLLAPPPVDPGLLRPRCRRLQELINRDLRGSFG